MKFTKHQIITGISLIFLISCGSKSSPKFNPSIVQQQKTANKFSESSNIASDLAGVWSCVDSVDCPGTELTFNPTLDSLEIDFSESDPSLPGTCRVISHYDLALEPELNGTIYFNIHTSSPATLDSTWPNADSCSTYIKNRQKLNLTVRHSFTHTDSWDQITLQEIVYKKKKSLSEIGIKVQVE